MVDGWWRREDGLSTEDGSEEEAEGPAREKGRSRAGRDCFPMVIWRGLRPQTEKSF